MYIFVYIHIFIFIHLFIYVYINYIYTCSNSFTLNRFPCDARFGLHLAPIWPGEDQGNVAQQGPSGLRKCAAEISTPPPLGTFEAAGCF